MIGVGEAEQGAGGVDDHLRRQRQNRRGRCPVGDVHLGAQILGVDRQLGALAPGLLANFIVTDGDPLETPTQVQRLFVQGREVEVGNRQTRLAEKYRQRYEQLKGR